MALHAALPRPAVRVWWGALVVVPLAFAGLGLALFPLQAAPTPPRPAPPVSAPVAPAPAYPAPFAAGAVTFAADRAELAGPSVAAVARVAALLGDGPGRPRVTVTGHAADTPGPAEVAQRLSERRAQVVADALVAAGVRRERLSSRAGGPPSPWPPRS